MKSLIGDLWGWDEERYRQGVSDDLAVGRSSILVVARRNVGWACLNEEPDRLNLRHLYISRNVQSQGIGKRYVSGLQAEARANGKSVRLRVLRNNPARKFYETLGFSAGDEVSGKVELIWLSV